MKHSCCICGTVKNCSKYIDKVLNNMEKIGSLFNQYVIILYYDHSSDDTLNKIINFQNKNNNLNIFSKIILYISDNELPNNLICHTNNDPLFNKRTFNIAKGRNWILNKIREKYSEYPYFIMMDCDDVCASDIDLNILKKYLYQRNNEWDALSFNREPYYDLWALSIGPYAYSCFHFNGGLDKWKQYISSVMTEAEKTGQLIPCYSAFNGFAIYKTKKFINCEYDGHERLDLIPKNLIEENIKVTGHIINCLVPNHQDSDCEHRAFHYSAIIKNGARIMIAPEKFM